MEFDTQKQEVILSGSEMEAVSISCDTFRRRNQKTLPAETIESLIDLSMRTAIADFALPDPNTGDKKFSISRAEAALAIQAAEQVAPLKEMADSLPKDTHAAIARIALFEIKDPSN